MPERIFTDSIMFFASSATLIFMLCVMILLIAWRDADAVWALLYCVFHAIITWFYFQSAMDNVTSIPTTLQGLIFRPSLFGIFVVVVTYTIYRLRIKNNLRKL